MSLRDTWANAKADSKTEFKKACKAKKEDLAKKAQGGNAAARKRASTRTRTGMSFAALRKAAPLRAQRLGESP